MTLPSASGWLCTCPSGGGADNPGRDKLLCYASTAQPEMPVLPQSLRTGMSPFPKASFEVIASAGPPEAPIRMNHSSFCSPMEHLSFNLTWDVCSSHAFEDYKFMEELVLISLSLSHRYLAQNRQLKKTSVGAE